MSGHSSKGNQIFDISLNIDPQFSYINIVQDELSKDPKRSHLKVQSKIRQNFSKSRDKTNRKSKDINAVSRSASRKKSKTNEKEREKNKKGQKKLYSKILINPKKQYKTLDFKSHQNKGKNRKPQKMMSMKKINLQSVIKKPQLLSKKKKQKDQLTLKGQKKYKTQKLKSLSKGKLKKSKSESALDRITLSQISKQPKYGLKQSKVMHQYFGLEDKLSSIEEERGNDRFNRDKTKLTKSKTQSSASSLSLRKHKLKGKVGNVNK